jgi:hypothetical protein
MKRRPKVLVLIAAALTATVAHGATGPPISVKVAPRLATIETFAAWTPTITVRSGGKTYRGAPPRVEVRRGRRSEAFAAARLRAGVFRARVVFRAPGRWSVAVRVAKRRFALGAVTATPGLSNVLDVSVMPDGSLLVGDLSNYVLRAQPGGPLTIVAGNGSTGSGGDGGPANAAAVGFPVEVAPDPRGGFSIVSDERRIRRVGPDGTIATLAELDAPTAHAYDAVGNLYVSELGGKVKRIDAASGVVTAIAEGLNRPHGLVVDRDGALLVCETFANRLVRIDLVTRGTATFAAGLNQPNDVALAPDGTLYVSEYGTNRIARIARDGRVTRATSAFGPNAVAVDAAGLVYYTEQAQPHVRRVDPATGISTIVLGR